MDIFLATDSLQKAFINSPEPSGALFMMDVYTFLGFKISTAIHCHYKAWKSQDIFNITLIVFVWKKKVIYT